MFKAMTTAGVLTLMGGSAFAEAHAMNMDDLIRTRDITGGTIYHMTTDMDDAMWADATYDGVDTEWNSIGEIEDIVLDSSGQMVGIVGEIGGFLDIADKHVVIPVGDVRLVPVDDRSYAFVTRMSEEQLEELPEVDEGFWD